MAETGVGTYVYCVIDGDERPPLDDLAGVADSGVGAVVDAGLCALVSAVPLDAFGERPLRRNLEDLAWVERTARAHDAVLTRTLRCRAVLPLRMFTIFTERAHVHALLADERAWLAATLGRLRDHAEWGVKARVDERQLQALLRHPVADAAPAPSPGRAYLARKQSDASARQRALAVATAVADELHGRLCAVATDATLLPPQRQALSGLPGTMILNGAYLVARGREGAFSATISELAARHRAAGFAIDVSGPCAPYNFVPDRESADARRARAPGHPA